MCIILTAESQAHVREPRNANDHPQVNVYFRRIGWKSPERIPGSSKPYCGAFIGWTLYECGLVTGILKKINMAAVAGWNSARSLFLPAGQTPLPGDVVTYKTWSHIEFVKHWPLDPRIRIFRAIGANTTGGAGRQQGVFTDIVRPKNIVRNRLRVL